MTEEFLWVAIIDVRLPSLLNCREKREIQDDIANYIKLNLSKYSMISITYTQIENIRI